MKQNITHFVVVTFGQTTETSVRLTCNVGLFQGHAICAMKMGDLLSPVR